MISKDNRNYPYFANYTDIIEIKFMPLRWDADNLYTI